VLVIRALAGEEEASVGLAEVGIVLIGRAVTAGRGCFILRDGGLCGSFIALAFTSSGFLLIGGGGLGLAARGGGLSGKLCSVIFVAPYSLARLSANPDFTNLVTEIGESSTASLLQVMGCSLDWLFGVLSCATGLAALDA